MIVWTPLVTFVNVSVVGPQLIDGPASMLQVVSELLTPEASVDEKLTTTVGLVSVAPAAGELMVVTGPTESTTKLLTTVVERQRCQLS